MYNAENNSSKQGLQLLQILTLIAALFMLLPLPVMQYVGEEGLNAIRSYEVFLRDDYLHSAFYGGVTPHAPLFNIPAILISNIIGWEHIDISIRLVSVMASWGSAVAAFFLARHLFPSSDKAPWLASLIYLSMGEVSFWYGWLGYVDAMFSCFIFSAVTCLWIALDKQKVQLLAMAIIFISIAYMVKNFTAIILLAITGFVLVIRLKRWAFVLKPSVILILLSVLITPWIFAIYIAQSSQALTITIANSLAKFTGYSLLDYIGQWLSYPFLFIGRAMPVSLLLLWLWLSRRSKLTLDATLSTLLLVILACLLPFWISAGASPRYLVPLYGLMAVLLTGFSLKLNTAHLSMVIKAIIIVIALKIPYSFGVLPYIKDWRPERDVKAVAQEIVQLVGDASLKTQNDISTGLAIAAYIDVWRQQHPPITWYHGKESNLYIIAEVESPELGQLVKTWRLRGSHVYLYHKKVE